MTIQLPPWGMLAGVAPQTDEPVRAWVARNPGKSPAHWKAFVDDVSAELGKNLWPVFDPDVSPAWVRIDDRLARLLQADFQIIAQLQREEIYNQRPGAVCKSGKLDHKQLFAIEDEGRLGENIEQYDDTFEYAAARLLPALILNGLTDTAGSFTLQIKGRHQRPRAYQTALLWPQYGKGFFHINAASGQTPAFISGHCLQSLLGLAAAWLALEKINYAVTGQQRKAMMQYGADIGDRRVFAGVHYPSDNLGSWIAVLRLCNEIADGEHLGRFIAESIPMSEVYRRIERFRAGRQSPFADAMEQLATLIKANS